MTDTSKTSRTALIAAMVGLTMLGAGGGYLYKQQAAPSGNNDTTQASKSADTAAAQAGISADERKATEAIVRAYILEHPEILSEAAEILKQREIVKRLDDTGDALTKAFANAAAGNSNGDVTLVEFSDYSCGFCRKSVADVQKLMDSDSSLRVVYRETPILSESSKEAAKWALAAAKQGKHKAFHDAMFAGARPDENSIRLAAKTAGMDIARAEQDANSAEVKAEIEANIAMMRNLGVGGTPTFVIGDQILEGALGYDALKAAIAKARKIKEKA
jgi:protein-disulfide isomerase